MSKVITPHTCDEHQLLVYQELVSEIYKTLWYLLNIIWIQRKGTLDRGGDAIFSFLFIEASGEVNCATFRFTLVMLLMPVLTTDPIC